MKHSKFLKSLLIISGIIGAFVGIEILFMPVQFYHDSGINLGNNISLLNELRATGGSLFACGILIIAGAFWRRITFSALLLSTLLYLSYGLSRLFSIAVDGTPVDVLIYVAGLELLIGALCAVVLTKYTTNMTTTS